LHTYLRTSGSYRVSSKLYVLFHLTPEVFCVGLRLSVLPESRAILPLSDCGRVADHPELIGSVNTNAFTKTYPRNVL
jgi:hypothetical protein